MTSTKVKTSFLQDDSDEIIELKNFNYMFDGVGSTSINYKQEIINYLTTNNYIIIPGVSLIIIEFLRPIIVTKIADESNFTTMKKTSLIDGKRNGIYRYYNFNKVEKKFLLNWYCYYTNDKLHRIGDVASMKDNTFGYLVNGILHREDGPALINGECKMFYTQDKLIKTSNNPYLLKPLS